MVLTVFTPTYNRRERLKKVYESLCCQTCKDFIWLIVDDGSTDDTSQLIKQWIFENRLKINYIYEENRGKAFAHNTAVQACETEAFTCLDSDDYLVEDAVERILIKWNLIVSQERIAGMISPRRMNSTNLYSNQIPEFGTIQDLYDRHGFHGETLIVFKTKILKKFMFPIFQNEKFVKEAVVYLKIDAEYQYYYLNSFLSCGEYLKDGLTLSGHKREVENPYSMLEYYKIGGIYRTNVLQRWKSAACYYAWKARYCLSDNSEEELSLTSKFFGRILSLRYCHIFSEKYDSYF